ncbi:hypothetical protein SLS64_007957 [Diaporthe eres]|uniref:Uncharacterized protein n=1 Tax=Diaporthe eres TaxID=83184 RepID=A0ABR1PFF1_DIAER
MAKSYISEPELVVVRMTSVEGEGDDYGTRYFAPDEEEAEVLENTLGTGMWFEVPAVQAMVIQRRIYQFLQLVVLRIMTDQSYAVANENNEKNWRPSEPDPNNVQSPQFNTDLSVYVDYLRNTMHYVAMNNTMELLTYGICYRQWTHYADQLKGLKSSPRLFYNYISDIREHSHHEVLHSINGRDERHRWPDINGDQRETKRREHAATRKASERNLAALWADLQPFLVEKQALSEEALNELNRAIPLVTADNGEDVFVEHPPPTPETSPQDEANQPSTPPGPSGTGDPTTPTQLLENLAVVTPTRPSPPKRSPEKKTNNDGVTKAPTHRRNTPADSPPRRPPTERRRERQERFQRLLAEQPAIAAPRPDTAPDQGREGPKIELNAANYELLRLIMTTDRQGRPGTVAWNDILAIFRDIGFSINTQSGRNSRGQITVFTPSEELCQSQPGVENIN